MITLNDLITELTTIRNFLDQVEVKGHTNRTYLEICFEKCNNLINDVTTVLQEKQNQTGSENGQNELTESKEG